MIIGYNWIHLREQYRIFDNFIKINLNLMSIILYKLIRGVIQLLKLCYSYNDCIVRRKFLVQPSFQIQIRHLILII